MNTRRKNWPFWIAIAVGLLAIANAFVAGREMGPKPGRTYRWVCEETGSELTYTPSQFGGTRLTGAPLHTELSYRWTRLEPRRLSPFLPWNWLTRWTESPLPDPEIVRRHALVN